MKKFEVMGVAGLTVMAWLGGCAMAHDSDLIESDDVSENSLALRQAKQDPQLNLSHIECNEDGDVLAHFVLLFAGEAQPDALSGTYNGGSFGPVDAEKNTGNVWHYNVILPSGEIEIWSAIVKTASGKRVSLHNPGEYSGTYECDEVKQCPVIVEAQDVYCSDQPLGNPGAECAAFGLLPQGKDDNLTGTSFTATQDAYIAIVKSGTQGCGPGQSAYRIYIDVSAGDSLLTPVAQNISHVTYCACPTDAADGGAVPN